MLLRLSLLLAFTSLGWTASAQKAMILSDARVSPGAQEIALSAARGKEFSVFEQGLLTGTKAIRISSEAPGFNCFAPAYSPDGHFLLYLKQPTGTTKKSNYADVIIYDRQLHTSQQLTTGQQIITQAVFSADSKRIVYVVAGFYGSYSPVGPKAAHELDLHSMAVTGTDPIQHSHLKAYLLGNLALLQAPGTYLLNAYDPRQKLSGTYAYSLSDSTGLKLVKDKIADERHVNYLPNFTVSAQKTLVYSIGDELFVKNMKNGLSEKIYTGQTHSNPCPMTFAGSKNAVIFSETMRDNPKDMVGVFSIKSLNLDDLEVVQVPINLD